MNARIAAIDGLRGIAILLVVGFHYFSGHVLSFEPAEQAHAIAAVRGVYGGFPLFRYGYLGVMLFFAISGFVISQSLHGSNGPWSFAARRFARLWPTMLLCCTATFLFSLVLPGVPRHPSDFLPSLTFIDPKIFNAVLCTNRFHWMDGVYWSLFTEVRFYAITAILYFASPRHFFRSMLAFSCCVGVAFAVAIACDATRLRSLLNLLCIATHLPWFTLGIGVFFAHAGQVRQAVVMCATSLMVLVVTSLAYLWHPVLPGYDARACMADIAAGFAVLALMSVATRPGVVGRLFSSRLISSIGIASYSLYLLHGRIGNGLLVWIGNPFGLSAAGCSLYPVIVAIAFILCSQIIYRVWETPMNRLIVSRLLGPRVRTPG